MTVGGAALLVIADHHRAEIGERRLRPVDVRQSGRPAASRAGRRSRSPDPWNRLRCSPIVNSRIRRMISSSISVELRQVDERLDVLLSFASDFDFRLQT